MEKFIVLLWYCLKCKKNTATNNPKVVKTKNGRMMLPQTVRFKVVKKRDLSKSKKQKNC